MSYGEDKLARVAKVIYTVVDGRLSEDADVIEVVTSDPEDMAKDAIRCS